MLTLSTDTDYKEYKVLRFKLIRQSNRLLGCSDYLPHLLVSYLDLHRFCFYCGVMVSYDTGTIEHLLPSSTHKGLLNKPKVLACFFCNRERSNKDLIEYLTSPRLIVDKEAAGFPFYKHFPQNAFEYLGMKPPSILADLSSIGHEFGLLD